MIKLKKIYKDGKKYIFFKTLKLFDVGNYLLYKNEEYLVIEIHSKIIAGIFFTDIYAVKKEEFNIEPIYNKNIKGSSILAKVIKLHNEDNIAYMSVDFEYGLSMLEKSYQTENKNFVKIPYKTYYSVTNSSLFSTPEIGDIVDVEFYNKDENFMKVSWALKNKNSSRFNNLDYRCFKTQYFDLIIDKENIELNIKKNINLHSNSINIISKDITSKVNESYSLASDGYIGLESIKETTIYGDNIDINSKKGDIKIFSKSNLLLKGKTINND